MYGLYLVFALTVDFRPLLVWYRKGAAILPERKNEILKLTAKHCIGCFIYIPRM